MGGGVKVKGRGYRVNAFNNSAASGGSLFEKNSAKTFPLRLSAAEGILVIYGKDLGSD